MESDLASHFTGFDDLSNWAKGSRFGQVRNRESGCFARIDNLDGEVARILRVKCITLISYSSSCGLDIEGVRANPVFLD